MSEKTSTLTVLVSPTTDRAVAKRAIAGLTLDERTATGEAIISSLQTIELFSKSLPGPVDGSDLAAEKLRLKHPGCNIVGARHGYFPADSDEVVAQEVAEAKPDILLVAMGIPRQEKFIKKTQHIINASVAMGVGGKYTVWNGKQGKHEFSIVCRNRKEAEAIAAKINQKGRASEIEVG